MRGGSLFDFVSESPMCKEEEMKVAGSKVARAKYGYSDAYFSLIGLHKCIRLLGAYFATLFILVTFSGARDRGVSHLVIRARKESRRLLSTA